jgi:chromosomal replication initiation ATPase DnaA
MEAAYFKTWNNHIPRTPIDIQNNEFVVNRTKNIIEFVTGLTYENYNVKSRRRNISFARQLFFYLVRQNSTLSLKSIGELFSYEFYFKDTNKMGRRWYDHTTVIHGIKTINDLKDGYASHEKKQILTAIEKFKQV